MMVKSCRVSDVGRRHAFHSRVTSVQCRVLLLFAWTLNGALLDARGQSASDLRGWKSSGDRRNAQTMWTNRPSLVDILSKARRHHTALEISIRVADAWSVVRSREKLQETLARAAALLASESLQGHTAQTLIERGMARTMFREITQSMYELLQQASVIQPPEDAPRLQRWELARFGTPASYDGPHLFEVDARGRSLDDAEFVGLHIQGAHFMASLERARVEDTLIDDCDFMYANLRSTIWRRGYVKHAFFRESCLAEAVLEQTTFVGCDLRRVDLSTTDDDGRRTGELRFVRCDLRGADLTGRCLARVTAYDCRLHGVRGVRRANPLRVRRADLSPWGNGSDVIGVDGPGAYVSDPKLASTVSAQRSNQGGVW